MDFENSWDDCEIKPNDSDKSFESFSNVIPTCVGPNVKRYSLSRTGYVDNIFERDVITHAGEQMNKRNDSTVEPILHTRSVLSDDILLVDMLNFPSQEERNKILLPTAYSEGNNMYCDAEFTPNSVNSMKLNLLQQNLLERGNYNISNFKIGPEVALNLCHTRLNQLNMKSEKTRKSVIGNAQSMNLPGLPHESIKQWSNNTVPNESIVSPNKQVDMNRKRQVSCESQEKTNISKDSQQQRSQSKCSHSSIAVAQKGRPAAFPQKLYQMLLDLEKQPGGAEIASFLQDGRAFAIHKPKEFAKYVIPKYFEMTCFASFQRQLNMYNFQQIPSGPRKGALYHELFIRGQPELYTWMKRIKGTRKNKSSSKSKNTKKSN